MSLFDSLQERLEDTHLYSGYFCSLCPWPHNGSYETNPSFFVYEESDNKNYEFRCASCGKHGSLVYLDKYLGSHHIQGLTQSHLRKPTVLPRWRSWEEKYGSLEGIANFAHQNVYKHLEFFKRRKIDEFIEKGHFGWLDWWNVLPVFGRTGRRVVDIVVRAGKHKPGTRYTVAPISNSNGHGLYSPDWERVEPATTIYVVFGMVDSWAFESLQLPCVTGVTGKSISAELLKLLNKRYVIVPDLDEEREAYMLANKLGWKAKVQKLNYEDGCKDPDDVRRTFGNEYLLNMLGV